MRLSLDTPEILTAFDTRRTTSRNFCKRNLPLYLPFDFLKLLKFSIQLFHNCFPKFRFCAWVSSVRSSRLPWPKDRVVLYFLCFEEGCPCPFRIPVRVSFVWASLFGPKCRRHVELSCFLTEVPEISQFRLMFFIFLREEQSLLIRFYCVARIAVSPLASVKNLLFFMV